MSIFQKGLMKTDRGVANGQQLNTKFKEEHKRKKQKFEKHKSPLRHLGEWNLFSVARLKCNRPAVALES